MKIDYSTCVADIVLYSNINVVDDPAAIVYYVPYFTCYSLLFSIMVNRLHLNSSAYSSSKS